MSLKKTQADEIQGNIIWIRVIDLLAVCLFWYFLCIRYLIDTFWASQCTFSSFRINISELNIRSSSIVYSIPNVNIPSESESGGKGQMISSVAKNSYRDWETGWGEGNISWTGARNLYCGEKFFKFWVGDFHLLRILEDSTIQFSGIKSNSSLKSLVCPHFKLLERLVLGFKAMRPIKTWSNG